MCPLRSAPTQLLAYWEERRALDQPIPDDFLRTAALLLAKLSELSYHPSYQQIEELAAHLKRLNEKRPQAASWTELDWHSLARLVLENRRLSTAVYFAPHPPFRWDREQELPLPFCAHSVGAALSFTQARLPAAPPEGLFQEAEELMRSVARDLKEARQALAHLQVLHAKLPPPHPGIVRRRSPG